MGIGSILGIMLIGALAGWVAGKLVTGYGFGFWGNIAVGVLGALFAGALLPKLGFGHGAGPLGGFVRAVVGAVLLLGLVRVFKRV